MALTLLHISDLHFGPPFVARPAEALVELAPTLGHDVLIASGDFTQRATAQQFADARALLDRLGDKPRITVPGNHDIALWRIVERLTRPRELYRKYINDELDSVHRFDGAMIVSLDSTSPRRCISNGRIHLDQLDFAERAFATVDNDDMAKIIVTHHHFAPAPDYERDQTMPKAKRAMDRFVEMGVDMIVGGHLHRAYIGNSLDVYPGPSREHGIIIVQCGTTTSRRGRGKEREKNTFNLIRIDQAMMQITHYMFFDHAGTFEPVSRHVFPRPGGRFVEPGGERA